MKPDALDTTNAESRQAVGVFWATELAFHGGAATVQPAPLVGTASDAAVTITLVLAERDYGGYAPLGALGVNPIVVISHIESGRRGCEAANSQGVKQGSDVHGFVTARCLDLPRER